jgi:hypothetical protein
MEPSKKTNAISDLTAKFEGMQFTEEDSEEDVDDDDDSVDTRGLDEGD